MITSFKIHRLITLKTFIMSQVLKDYFLSITAPNLEKINLKVLLKTKKNEKVL